MPGFPFYKPADAERRELGPGLQSFLYAGAPPVIFTLGSFAPEVSGDFYDQSIRAARALGRRAVLLAGAKDAARLASIVGPHEYVCEHAPHGLLFPKGLCIVHHGGIGTAAEALRAGKPQIVVPFFGDQPDHGARVKRLGLGLPIKLSGYDERRAVAALQSSWPEIIPKMRRVLRNLSRWKKAWRQWPIGRRGVCAPLFQMILQRGHGDNVIGGGLVA